MKLRLTILCCLAVCFSGIYVFGETERPESQDSSLTRVISLRTEDEQEQNRHRRCAGLFSPNVQADWLTIYKTLQHKKDWLILVDPQHVLPKNYKPKDLVTQSQPGWPKKAQLRQEAMEQMLVMIKAAKADGVTLIPVSTYRTQEYQDRLYRRNLARNGGKPTGYVARAGESQHHLGSAVDFNTVNPKDENIPALVWMRRHAGKYGFSLSFPKGPEAEKESGYPYEAWHYRYIGKEAVALQDTFFGGNHHRTLKFLHDCIFTEQTLQKEIL